MAAIEWAEVAKFVTSLSSVDEDVQDAILAHVNTTLVVSRFRGGEDSPKLHLARIYLAAHHGEMHIKNKAGNSGGGSILSKKISKDSLEVQYGDGSSAAEREWLAETSWGREYLDIMGTVASGRGPLVT